MENLLKQWNIECNKIIEVQKKVWYIDDSYYLKSVENKEWIKNLQIYRRLRELGIPSPEVISTIDGNNYVEHNASFYYLSRKLKGRHYSKEEVMKDPETARFVGKIIARLHKAFSALTDEYKFYNNNFVDELKGWIKNNLEEYVPNSFTYEVYSESVNELDLVYGDLVRHLIHRDLHLGNLLFVDRMITGYIDFDLAQVNARIFDLAYFLVGWIVDEVNDDEFMNNWKHSVLAMLEGYQEELKLTETELKSLGIMMCCIEILFVAYFSSVKDLDNTRKAEECLKWLWRNRFITT